MRDESRFTYSIDGDDAIAVVRLSGEMDLSSVERIEALRQALAQSKYKACILSFNEVTGFNSALIPLFIHVLKSIREARAELRMCGLRPELTQKLEQFGVLRSYEQAENAYQAICTLTPGKRKAA